MHHRSSRLSAWLAALLALCTGCAGGATSGAEAGAFSISRRQQSYRNWDTGSKTSYYTYDVRYRGKPFSFPVRYSYSDMQAQPQAETSTRIARAFVVSTRPAAILVLAGDPNNDASWTLLRDTPQGISASHVAFYADGDQFAWLDGIEPQPIDNPRELLALDGGRWLWVGEQALLDRQALQVRALQAPGAGRHGAQFVAFSPDRSHMARFSTRDDPADADRWVPVILVNDIASGAVRLIDIDAQQQWFDDNRDIDRHWLEAYFEWHADAAGQWQLQPRKDPQLRPYHGRLNQSSRALQYHAPRARLESRREVMDAIVTGLAATPPASYVMDVPAAAAPPPAAAAAAPAMEGDPIARADLRSGDQVLAVYFSARGLSIDNDDPALDGLLRDIARILDAKFASPQGQRWITAAGKP